MKREEAIQVLQTALTAPFIYGEYAEAIDMAIEALRNCSEIPNGSLIRRQDIKYHTQLEAMGNGQYEEVEVAYKNDIESLQSADRPSEMMTQEEAMNMSNEQAVQILIPMRNMMCDQNGCPISDAVFALDKAIEALSADRPTGECKTCKRSSDYRWSIGENDTRCPIEEHYALPKDGYCHLYEPYREDGEE